MKRPDLKVMGPKRYGRRIAISWHIRRKGDEFYRTGGAFIDPLPRPSSLGVRLGITFWPMDDDGQRVVQVGAWPLAHLVVEWTPREDPS